MRRENLYRVSWIEKWISEQADGLIHTQKTPEPPEKKVGRPGDITQEEIDCCLGCPFEDCKMDRNGRCDRVSAIRKKNKSKRRNEK